MANYLTTDTDLTAVADAIRTKGGTSAALSFPDGFVDAIDAITTGGGDAETYVDNIIGNVTFQYFYNDTYTGNNLDLSRIPARNIEVVNATKIGPGTQANSATTGIISVPNLTATGGTNFSASNSTSNMFSVFYAPKLKSLASNFMTATGKPNLVKLVMGSAHPFNNTKQSMRGTPKLKALVIHATTPPTLSEAQLTRLNACGIVQNSDGYIYVPASALTAFQTATNWSTIGADKFRAIEDYPLIDAPTTWLPEETT